MENQRRLERAELIDDADSAARFRMQELSPGISHGLSEVAYVATALGVNRADWSMSFEPSSLGFFDGVLTRPVLYVKQDLLAAMLGELASNDRGFAQYYDPSFVFSPYGYDIGLKLDMAADYGNRDLCALLAERARSIGAPALESVERVDERRNAELPLGLHPPTAVLKRCAVCHESGTPMFAGVEIPFTDPTALRQKLLSERSLRSGKPLLGEMLTRISAHARQPMPPASAGTPVDETERGELANYLAALGVPRL